MTKTLCPICFSRFVDYESFESLYEHITKEHTEQEIELGLGNLEFHIGFVKGCLKKVKK